MTASPESRAPSPESRVDLVIKFGGSLIDHPAHLTAVLAIISDAARKVRMLLVPGGGPFADVVRTVDREIGLSDDAAHWMAVLGMDQYAHLITSRLEAGVLVTDRDGIRTAIDQGRVPVLAPSRWLQDADPLPHSWQVTSDSIAAWIAGAVGANTVILVKAPGAGTADVVDEYFQRACPASISALIVDADDSRALQAALRG